MVIPKGDGRTEKHLLQPSDVAAVRQWCDVLLCVSADAGVNRPPLVIRKCNTCSYVQCIVFDNGNKLLLAYVYSYTFHVI